MDTPDIVKGHRQRLRQRFLKNGRKSLADYELLELLLTYAIPRKDTKPMAKALLQKFKSFNAVLNQSTERLMATKGIGPHSSTFISIIRSCIERYLEQNVEHAESISSPEEIVHFVRVELGAKQRECLMALYLSDSNRLLHHAVISEGTVNKTGFYPREILRQGLTHNATGLIIVHNHPNGEAIPSENDLEMTQKIEEVSAPLAIRLLDHIIVTETQAYSVKTGKLL